MNLKETKLLVQIILTVLLGLLAIYLIVVEPQESVKLKWAFGTVGIIIGYWLK